MEGEEQSSHSKDGLDVFTRLCRALRNAMKESIGMMLHDQARAALARAISPDPLNKHTDTKT